jgi:hypothetical protein
LAASASNEVYYQPMKMVQIWAPLLMVALSAGCGQNDIRVYRVAKEAPQPELTAQADAASVPPGHPDISSPSSGLKWKLPTGWEEVPPGEMRVASFRVKGENGKQADVSIVPLGGRAGGDLSNVNRWRVEQLGQSPVTEEQLAKLAQPIEIAGQPAQLFEQAGKPPNSDDKARILGAIQHRSGTAWFFKMSGDDALVAAQKPVFIDFLKSLGFPVTSSKTDLPPSHPPIDSTALASAQLPTQAASGEAKPQWQVPAGWQETSGQFLVAKFLISGPDNGRATVNVSITGGGLAANVNRWRNQLGLQPLAQAELEKQMQPLEVPGGKAMLIDMSGTDAMTNQKARLVGVILLQADRTWYYKLMGNPQLVQQQKDAFIKFVKTAKYP